MKILIIAAMPQEIEAVNALLSSLEANQYHGIEFHHGKREKIEVITALSGIGKVNSAVATALLIQKFNPDYIINTGSAGGLVPNLSIGDVAIADRLIYHDVDVTAFGYQPGQVPKMPPHYEPDDFLVKSLSTSKLEGNVTVGSILSGDSFIANDTKKSDIAKHFPEALVVDMESCSIAQTCYRFNKSFAIVRSVSDVANQKANLSFEEFLPIAAKNSASIAVGLFTNLTNTY